MIINLPVYKEEGFYRFQIKEVKMKDLKVYYQRWAKGVINENFDADIEKLAEKYGLSLSGCGFDFTNQIRDMHFEDEGINKKRGR